VAMQAIARLAAETNRAAMRRTVVPRRARCNARGGRPWRKPDYATRPALGSDRVDAAPPLLTRSDADARLAEL
jgi:hypothetical protein